jgi:anti-sigma factor RsiW
MKASVEMWWWRPWHCTDSALVALLDGELDRHEQAAARRHVAECNVCSTRLQRQDAANRSVIDLLKAELPGVPSPVAHRRHLAGGVAGAGLLVASVGAIVAAGIVVHRRRHHTVTALGDGHS